MPADDTAAGSPWSRFRIDPRENPQLRAADADRLIVTDCLAEAYADGRLDAAEFDERMEAAGTARTLGQLPALLEDLAPPEDELLTRLQALEPAAPLTPEAIEAAAQEHYRTRRRHALLGMLAGPVGICLAIWAVTSIAAREAIFFWPIFVILGTGMGSLTVLTKKREIIDRERIRLTEKARAQLEQAQQRSTDEEGEEG